MSGREPRRRLRVIVLFGGRSSEHAVSTVSARHVIAAMDQAKYEVVPIGIDREGHWLLPDVSRKVLEGAPLEMPAHGFHAVGEPVAVTNDPSASIVPLDRMSSVDGFTPDVVFPVLHGPYGEDGSVQGLLELSDIPYVGAGVLGSALGMDKEKMKIMFRAADLPICEYIAVRDYEWEKDRAEVLETATRIGFPCFVKPSNLGSSVGISKCDDGDELRAAIADAFRYDRKILIEEMVFGRELECGVLGNESPEASVVGEVISSREFYDYEAKYLDEGSRTVIPADIPEAVSNTIHGYALRAFKAVEAEGMARVDFFYGSGAREVTVNEINTIPGFTTISMFPKLWEASGVNYGQLIDRLIQLALDRKAKKRRPETLPMPEF